MFAQYVYIPYQTTYLTGIGVSGNVVGTIVGAYGISQLLLRLPVGICADRIGRHKAFIMLGALASGSASFIIYMVFAILFAALASSPFCTRKGPGFWIPAVLLVLAGTAVLGSILAAGYYKMCKSNQNRK